MRNVWYIIFCSLAILAVFFFLPDEPIKLKVGITVILGAIAWIKATAAIGHRWPEVRGKENYIFFLAILPFWAMGIFTLSKLTVMILFFILAGKQPANILNAFPLVPLIIALVFLGFNLVNEMEKKKKIIKS